MKKLIALLFCLAVLVTTAQAQVPQQASKKTSVVQQAVAQKTNQTLLEKKLEVEVVMSVQTQQYDSGNLQTTYICQGVIINAAGDIAIKKDCLPVLNLANESDRTIELTIDMKKLGTYKKGEFAGDEFFYKTDDAEYRTFAIAKDFIIYALPFKEANSEVKASLNSLFKGQKPLTAQRVSALLSTLPQTRVQKKLLRH